MIWLLLACTEYNYSSKVQKDVFQQARRNTVDILLVVDDSCSMAEEQEKLSNNFDAFISAFSGVDVDWQIGVTTTDTYYVENPGRLIGGEDEVILVDPDGRTIDSVKWKKDWAYDEGVAMQLSAEKYSTTSNTSIMNWCFAADAYGDGDFGTPGTRNPSCARSGSQSNFTAASSEDTGTQDTGTQDTGAQDTGDLEDPIEAVRPNVGDIIFTEIMIDALAVEDRLGEWIELTNLSEDALDISDYAVQDDGSNYFVFPANTIIQVGEAFVIGRSDDSSVNGGVEVDIVSDNLTLANRANVLTSGQDDVQENFEEMVVVGTSGSGIEMGLEAARQGLSEPMLAGLNAGFLREEANLSIIFVSDEDDYSPLSAHSYLRAFTDLKGAGAYRNNSMVNVSAVIGKERPPYEGDPSCVSGSGIGFYGPKYIELVNRTSGSLESICDEDFSAIAAELGLVASGLQLEFALSGTPALDTLKVSLFAEDTEESFVKDFVYNEDYRYSIENNSVIFIPEALPDSETYILAEYQVLSIGASITEDDLNLGAE